MVKQPVGAKRAFRVVRYGVSRVERGFEPRHYHDRGYALIVLEGRFTEASFSGRHAVECGDVLLHGAFDAHADGDGSARIDVLRLPWDEPGREGKFRVVGLDDIVRASRESISEAVALLKGSLVPSISVSADWPIELAGDLSRSAGFELRTWAERRSLRPETLSRGFRQCFDVTAQRFRLEARTRNAWRCIVSEGRSLTDIAQEHGFADLAHMSRCVAALTGRSPSAWRDDALDLGESFTTR